MGGPWRAPQAQASKGVRGMLTREIFKYGVSKIAFPTFWEQFSTIFNWLKSLENVIEIATGKQNKANQSANQANRNQQYVDIVTVLLWNILSQV